VDNWLFPKYDNNVPVNHASDNPPYYAYQTLSENLRGYKQNVKNGTNVLLMNTELRLPVFATFIEQPINSNFLRNFQITSFMDIGTAWNEKLSFKDQSDLTYYDPSNPNVIVQIKNSNLGPFVGGYGFGARTALGGYFLRFDAAWPMTGFFEGKPMLYLALGVDF
jgi:hemolysin activation/secretion protein